MFVGSETFFRPLASKTVYEIFLLALYTTYMFISSPKWNTTIMNGLYVHVQEEAKSSFISISDFTDSLEHSCNGAWTSLFQWHLLEQNKGLVHENHVSIVFINRFHTAFQAQFVLFLYYL